MSIEPESRPDLSIVIVCFNNRGVLMPCLESIFRAPTRLTYEVVVVDNASGDGTAEEVRLRFPRATVVEAGYNAGFTGGNNIGIGRCTGDWVLFLNPDTLVIDDALDVLVERARALPSVGAIGPYTLNTDGTLQRSIYRSPRLVHFIDSFLLRTLPAYSRLFGFYGYRDSDYEREMEVDIVQGSCFVSPRALIESLGAFDEGFFLYYEEADLQERIRAAGFKVWYTPRARIVHLGGASTVKQLTWCRIECERSRARFFSKHRSRLEQLLLPPVRFVDSLLRVGLGLLAVVVTLGRAPQVRTKTGVELAVLRWLLGLRRHGERPRSTPSPASSR